MIGLLITAEVAELLRVHKKTVQRWARAGIVPGKRIGGEWRYLRDEIDEWLRRRDQPTAEAPALRRHNV